MYYPNPDEDILKILSQESKPKDKIPFYKKRKPDAVYRYVDADGVLVYEVCRFDPKTGFNRKKLFVPRYKIGGDWIWNLQDGPERILYKLDYLTAQVEQKNTKRIYVCEGEKDVANAEAMSLVATTLSGGAKAYNSTKDISILLEFDEIILLSDNDKDGKTFMKQIALRLINLKRDIKLKLHIVCPQQPKGDLADWINVYNGTREKLIAILDTLPHYNPIAEAKEKIDADEDTDFEFAADNYEDVIDLFLETKYDCERLRYYVEDKNTKDFWEWTEEKNGYEKIVEEEVRLVLRGFLKHIWLKGKKNKKFPTHNAAMANLMGCLRENPNVLITPRNTRTFDILPVTNGHDPELIVPFRNGNWFFELVSPYRRLSLGKSPNHFETRPLDYDYNPEILQTELQPKIHQDWFEGDEKGRQLFYEIFGYFLTSKNIKAKVVIWLRKPRAGKSVGTFQYESGLNEDNFFPTKLKKVVKTFGTGQWNNYRVVNLPDIGLDISDKQAKRLLREFVGEMKAISGRDRTNTENKFKLEKGQRLLNHFLLVSNDEFELPDFSEALLERIIFLPWEHNLVKEGKVKINENLFDLLTEEKEKQCFMNLCLNANKARLERGGQFSVSKYTAKYIKDFRLSGDWALAFWDSEIISANINVYTTKSDVIERVRLWHKDNIDRYETLSDIAIGKGIRRAAEKMKVEIGEGSKEIEYMDKQLQMAKKVAKVWYGFTLDKIITQTPEY
jgi:5S rRNA maturation endonuclease (ribonuclease M5)